VKRYATRGDLLRGWHTLSVGAQPPRKNVAAPRRIRKFLEQTGRDNRYFGRLSINGWSGHFFKHSKFPRRWSRLSQLNVTPEELTRVWTDLHARIERDELNVLKRSRSGDVLSGEIQLAGEILPIIVKRPRKKYWYRYLNSIGRASRAERMWTKAWSLFIRNFPVEWPLMVMERKTFGYVTDSIIVFEKMQGTTLAQLDLDSLTPGDRDMIFRRLGRTLRLIEQENMTHFDAKSTNWIIRTDDATGPLAILIDVDGVRHYRWTGEGIDRLLRAMREHPQYTVEDSLALCQGYAPYARYASEMFEHEEATEGESPS
jgi:tRNA A-37 threonylcarbamoyl transferase component Bud32